MRGKVATRLRRLAEAETTGLDSKTTKRFFRGLKNQYNKNKGLNKRVFDPVARALDDYLISLK